MFKTPDWFNNMFLYNQWGWFHMIGGGVAYDICSRFWHDFSVFSFIFFIAILWEFVEYQIDHPVEKVYGSKKRFFLDATGDIVLAMVGALIGFFG